MSDEKAAVFWDRVSAQTGYTSALFKKEGDVHYDDLFKPENRTALVSYLRATQNYLTDLDPKYRMDAEQLANNTQLAKELVEKGRDTISWFNNNIAVTVKDAATMSGKTPAQKMAFLYMLDTHDRMSMDMSSVGKFLWQGVATDVTMLASIGASFFTLGGATAVGVAATQATRAATIATIRTAAATGVRAGLNEVGHWAVQKGISTGIKAGFVDGAVTSLSTTWVKSSEIEIDGQKAQRQRFFSAESAGDIAFGTGFGMLAGGTIAGVAHYGGKAATNTWNKWRGNTVSVPPSTITTPGPSTTIGATPSPVAPGTIANGAANTVVSGGKIIPDPENTWIHQVARNNPVVWFYKLTARANSPDMYIPARGFMSRKYVRPVIEAVDDRAKLNGITDAVNQTRITLETIASELKNNKITIAEARKQASDVIETFAKDNNGRFKAFNDSLDPVLAEVQSVKTAATARAETGRGHFGLENRQVSAFTDYIRDVKQTATNISGGSNKFVTDYMAGLDGVIKKNVESSAVADEILGGFQKVSEFSRFVDMRVSNRQADNLHGLSNLRNNWGKRTDKLEDLRMLERQIIEGYYNPHRRTADVANKKFSNPDNSENFGIRIELFAKSIKKDPKGDLDFTVANLDQLGDLVRYCYDVGREHEALYAIWHLQARSNRSSAATFPGGIYNRLKANPPPNGGPHYDQFIKAVQELSADVRHSPVKYGQRDIEAKYTEWSYWFRMARKFPSQGEISVPFIDKFYNNPKGYAFRAIPAYLTGGRVIASENPNNPLPTMKWFADAPKGADGKELGGGAMAKHYLWETGKLAVRVPMRWATLPILPGYKATEFMLTAAKKPLIATGALGLGLWGVEEGSEALIPNGSKPRFLFNEKGNLVVPFTNVNVDLGSRVLGAGLWATDMAIAPVRWNMSAIKGVMGTDSFLGSGIQPDMVSLKYPREWNVRYLGDRGSETPATTPPAAVAPNAGASQAAGGGAAVVISPAAEAALSPADKAKRDAVRLALWQLGQNVSNLTIAVAKDGWTDAHKTTFEALKANYATVHGQAEPMDLGAHAKDIDLQAKNLLNDVLTPSLQTGIKPAVPALSFEQQDAARQTKTATLVTNWYNGVLALNNDVALNGWNKERQDKLAALKTQQEAFYKDTQFLQNRPTVDYAQMQATALNWQIMMLAAQNSQQAVAPLTTPPASLPAQLEVRPAGGGAPAGTPVAGAGTVGAPPAGAPGVAVPPVVGGGTASTGAPPAGTPGVTVPPVGGSGAPVVGGGTGAPAPSGSSSGGRSFGDAAGDFGDAFADATRVEGGDNVTRMVGATGNMLGAAATGAGGWLKNSYNRLMAKQDGSGRALIREGSAGILSIIAMASFVGPMLDKLGIGKIPFVGSLVKLAALVAVFMVARKGIDSFMSPVTPSVSTGVAQSATGNGNVPAVIPTAVPPRAPTPLTPEQMGQTGGSTQTQSHGGGTPSIAPNAANVDPAIKAGANAATSTPAAQLSTTKDTTFVPASAANDDIFQSVRGRSNVIHIPADRLNGRRTDPSGAVEAVPHDKPGADSVPMNMSGKNQLRPAVDGNNALAPEMR